MFWSARSRLAEPKLNSERVLLFSPHALITPHAKLETALARLFLSAGDKVEVVRCDGELIGGCTVQIGEPPDSRNSICQRCQASARLGDSGAGYSTSRLSQVELTPFEEQEIVQLGALSSQELRDYKIMDVQLGAFWSYDLALFLKDPEQIVDSDHHEKLLRCAQAGLRAFFVGLKKINEFHPTAVVVYSQQYGVNRCFAAAARLSDVPVLNVHHRGPLPDRFRSFSVSIWDRADKPIWRPNFAELLSLPLLATEVDILSTHFQELYKSRAHMVYSKARGDLSAIEIRDKLGLRSGRVVVVAMSSPDEPLAAALAHLLPDSFSVLDDFTALQRMMQLTDHFPEIDFVFRVHPRLFPNAREETLSPFGPEMVSRLREKEVASQNFHVSLPGDPIGLYDLIVVADALVTQRSSAANEFAVLGIPVIYSDSSMNPIDKTVFPTQKWSSDDTLHEQLAKALSEGPTYDQALAHLRYAATALIRSVVPIRERPKGLVANALRDAATAIISRIMSVPAKSLGAKPPPNLEIDRRLVTGEGLSVSEAIERWPLAEEYEESESASTSELELVSSFIESTLPVFGKTGAGSGIAFRG